MTNPIHLRNALQNRWTRLSLIFGFASIASSPPGIIHAVSTPAPSGTVLLPRGPDRTIDLSTLVGQTYLQAMQASETGILDRTEADNAAAVTMASADQTVGDVNQFSSKVSGQVFGMFKSGQTDFHSVIAKHRRKIVLTTARFVAAFSRSFLNQT